MQKKTLEYIRRHHMFNPGDHVIVALSGGADSVCLLCLLDEMKEELQIELRAVHVHHGLRGEEADRDADYAKELCDRLRVPCIVVHRDVAAYAKIKAMSVEEAGRTLRYEVLYEEAKNWGDAKIAVAHHGDDQAETILHNLFRGSGLKGLGGISSVRGPVVRPLLSSDREEILRYLGEKEIPYCEDSTNISCDYTRNKLRHQILPLIRTEVNEGAVSNILHAGELAAEADAYLEKTAQNILKEHARRRDGEIGLPDLVFCQQEAIIQKYLIMAMLEELCGSKKDITSLHIGQVCALKDKAVGRQTDLPYGMRGIKDYDSLWVTKKQEALFDDATSPIGQPTPEYRVFSYVKGQEIPKNQYTKWFDYDKIKGTLSTRVRQTGDFITLASGGRKTIKSFMIDEKIPKEARERIFLLADGNHILWIIGYRISEYYKISENTKRVLQVKLDGGKNDG